MVEDEDGDPGDVVVTVTTVVDNGKGFLRGRPRLRGGLSGSRGWELEEEGLDFFGLDLVVVVFFGLVVVVVFDGGADEEVGDGEAEVEDGTVVGEVGDAVEPVVPVVLVRDDGDDDDGGNSVGSEVSPEDVVAVA